jgi:hypothetical protein
MNVVKLIVFTDSMMNAKIDTALDYGKSFKMFLIACLSLLLLTTRFSACTEDYHQS